MRRQVIAGVAAVVGVSVGVAGGPAVAHGSSTAGASSGPRSRHVLVLSVDGMHQSDLTWWIARHPGSVLAKLVTGGTEYTRATTTFPSDSFPGMVAQFTGASAGTSGVYYDDTYNRSLLPAGTVDCSTAAPGSEVSWTEAADRSQNPITLDAGQGIAASALTDLPTNTKDQTVASAAAITRAILHMTPTPQALLSPSALPVDPATCLPVYPHQYLKVNTVFEVARAHGLRTAWSDKHPAYEILSGPSGSGVQDLFTPEINAIADNAGDDWTTDNALTRVYDGTKVAAVLNEIDGYDHTGLKRVGTPAIFGMNFQSVSTAQKLPTSDGLTGGYRSDGTPGPLLTGAITSVDAQIARMERALSARHLLDSTTIILSAKHGQSPIDPAALRRVDDGAIIDAIDAAWKAKTGATGNLVAFSVDDDGMLLWLVDHSAAARAFVRSYLLTHSAPANRISDPLGTYSTSVSASGLRQVFTGAAAATLVGARGVDSRTPDVIGIAQHGVVYTGKVKKISEHGGDAADDRDVPLIVSGAGVGRYVNTSRVQTTQIAPTILSLLGLDPWALAGDRIDRTAVLPR